MAEPRIQYAKTSDGVSIAYWTMGDGESPLVMSSPFAWSHISLELRARELASWYKHLASGRMLVRYDQRNQGLSDRNVERLSHEEQASDVPPGGSLQLSAVRGLRDSAALRAPL